MPIVDSYPVIVTPRLAECRDFYQRWLAAEIVFEASWIDLVQQVEPAPGFWDPYLPG